MNPETIRKYLPVILAVCDRICDRGPMMQALRVQKQKRILAALELRDKQKSERSGIPLPGFLHKYV
jgi:hypothetical protein